MSTNKIEQQSFGDRGAIIALPATGEVTGQFCALQFIGDTVLTSLSSKGLMTAKGDDGTGVTFPAGFVFYGNIESFEITSGSVVGYLKS